MATRLAEIRTAVKDGASEIDVVINRQMALTANWKGLASFYYMMFAETPYELPKKF